MGNKQFTLIFVIIVLLAFTQVCVSTQTVTLDLNGTPNKVAYNKLINEIRQFVKGKLEYDGIPMMQAPSVPPAYIVVKLLAKRGATDISLSVAISKTNLYVVGYADESTRKAFFFSDSKEAKPSIFTGMQLVKEILHFGSGYGDLENKSGTKRETLILSLDKLKFSMLTLHGEDATKPSFIHDQATFLIYAIQAFSEAARFKYVQKKFNTPIKNPPEPDYKVPKLENSWQTISKAVKNAIKRKLEPSIILVHDNGSSWVVTTVDEIKPDMGIMSYVS